MTSGDIAQRRLDSQRLTTPDLATPAEVARWFGAVQAQEYAWSLYGVGLRMGEASEQAVEQAIAERSIVRTWPMRGTIHSVPADDAAWMLRLLARRTNQKAASVYHRAGLDAETFARAGEVLAEALRGGKVLPRKRLYAALEAAGIATSGEQRGLHLLGYWAREGLVCLGPREGKQPTFTLLDEWVPNARGLDDDEALAILAGRYFTSHGPATVQDFAWWSGLTLTEARAAVALAGDDLTRETVAGVLYLAGGREVGSASGAVNGRSASLLPPYDEFTVAYRDRSALLGKVNITDPFVILGPVIVVDGQIVGAWKRTLVSGAAQVTLTLFTPLDEAERVAVEQAAARYGRFVGRAVVVLWE